MFPIAVSVNVMVACSVVVFIAGVLGGLLVGIFIGFCWGKKSHPPPLAAPLYEDITVTTTPGTQFELKDNIAYGIK